MGEGNISTIWIQCFGCTMFSLDGCCWLLLLLLSIFRWLLPVLLVYVGFQIKMKDGKLSGACGNLEIFFSFQGGQHVELASPPYTQSNLGVCDEKSLQFQQNAHRGTSRLCTAA